MQGLEMTRKSKWRKHHVSEVDIEVESMMKFVCPYHVYVCHTSVHVIIWCRPDIGDYTYMQGCQHMYVRTDVNLQSNTSLTAAHYDNKSKKSGILYYICYN